MVKHDKEKKKKKIRTVGQETGTAAPGKTPEFRTTIQGDRFDINKPLVKNEFSSAKAFEQAKGIKEGGAIKGQFVQSGGFFDPKTATQQGLAATPGRIAERKVVEGEQRKEQVIGELETQQTKEELKQQIAQPPSLEPGSFVDTATTDIAEIGLAPAASIGNLITAGLEKATGKQFGRTSAEELADTKFGKALGVATAGVGAGLIAAAGYAAIPFLTQQAARTTIGKAVATNTFGLKTIAEAALLITVGGKAVDFDRGEINTMRKRITGIVEDGERIEASVRNGLDPDFAIKQLKSMASSVEASESAIKQLSIYNIKYRTGEEYLADMEDIIGARTSLLRRVEAIENIAIQGTAALNPEALMLEVSQF